MSRPAHAHRTPRQECPRRACIIASENVRRQIQNFLSRASARKIPDVFTYYNAALTLYTIALLTLVPPCSTFPRPSTPPASTAMRLVLHPFPSDSTTHDDKSESHNGADESSEIEAKGIVEQRLWKRHWTSRRYVGSRSSYELSQPLPLDLALLRKTLD